MNQLSDLFKQHIQKLTKQYSEIITKYHYEQIVIHSGTLTYHFLDDMPFPFKANPHFVYWVPVTDNPDCFVIVKPGEKPTLLYFQAMDYWYEVPQDPSGFWTSEFNIKIVTSEEDIKKELPKNLSNTALISAHQDHFSGYGFKAINPDNLMNEFHYLRASKSPYEQYCMKQASLLGAKAHTVAKDAFFAGKSEYDIHLLYMSSIGFSENQLPYGNIVAINEHGATLHYTKVERQEQNNLYSFLLDAGAEFNGYASDITRTYSYKKDEFHDMIEALNAEQLKLIDQLKVGDPYPDTHIRSHHAIARILSDFKFVNLPASDIVEKRISHIFYPHGIGHLLGLQVHDIGGFMEGSHGGFIQRPDGHPYLRLTRKIEDGFVFTIEPGLYFIDMLLNELKKSDNSKYVNWEKVSSFIKYGGIRIEDNVLVTTAGVENFTRQAFASLG